MTIYCHFGHSDSSTIDTAFEATQWSSATLVLCPSVKRYQYRTTTGKNLFGFWTIPLWKKCYRPHVKYFFSQNLQEIQTKIVTDQIKSLPLFTPFIAQIVWHHYTLEPNNELGSYPPVNSDNILITQWEFPLKTMPLSHSGSKNIIAGGSSCQLPPEWCHPVEGGMKP